MSNIDEHDVSSLDPDRTALVVVDLQKGFTSSEGELAQRGWNYKKGQSVVPKCATLVDAAHETEMPIAFTRLIRRPDGKDAPSKVFDIYPTAYDDYGKTICQRGTRDAEYSEGIKPREQDYEVEKAHQDAFHGTPLDLNLRTEGVDTIVVCGLTSNVCVESTIRGAHERGYNVVMVEDATAAHRDEMHEATLENVEYMFGVTATVDEVLDRLPTITVASKD
jgi:ureidoacrylate peracid hydrolase